MLCIKIPNMNRWRRICQWPAGGKPAEEFWLRDVYYQVRGIHDKIQEEQYRPAGRLGSGLAWPLQAGLETGDTADLEVGATTNVVYPADLAI
jgi:hypothetical protein